MDPAELTATPGWLRRTARGLREGFARVVGLDVRTLALFRVTLASLTLIDLWNRAPDIEAFYTDFGVLPRATFIEQFANPNLLSFHFLGGTVFAASLLFIVHAVIAALLLVGWRTRLMTVLGWLFIMSLHGRNPVVLQGGDVLFRLLYFWAMFLPLGARWSVDAALSRPELARQATPETRVTSAATLAIVLQTCFVYWFTMALKTGDEWWKDFTAVHYALHLDHFATPIAEWLREMPALMKGLTITTAWVEIIMPVLALAGGFYPPLRLFAVGAMVGLHLIFGSALKIGLFPFVSSLSWLVLMPGWVWDRLAARLQRRRPVVFFDVAGVAATRWAWLLKEGLILGNASIRSHERSIEPAFRILGPDGEALHGRDALRAVLAASWILSWLRVLTPLLAPIAGLVHRSAVFGLGSRRLARARIRLPNVRLHPVLQVLVLLLLAYVTAWNVGTLANPTTLSVGDTQVTLHPVKMDKRLRALGYTLRLDQTWNMFAPRPMRSDGWFIIPAVLSDGRVIDLFREGAEIHWDKPESVSSEYPGQRWRKYLMNLWTKDFKKHRRHYGRYLCRLWDRELPDGVSVVSLNLLYMKEETLASGPAPVECQSLWEHWCAPSAKSKPKPDYMNQCAAITRAAKAHRSAVAAAP